jgi:hypothetical protein
VNEESPRKPPPATDAGKQAADASTTEFRPPAVEQAHGEAIAHAAAENVAGREAEQATREADAAREEAESLSRKERKAREKAEQERRRAEEERGKADEAVRREEGEALARAAETDARDAVGAVGTHQAAPGVAAVSAGLSGATLTGAGVGAESAPHAQAAAAAGSTAQPEPPARPAPTSPDDRPELLVGAAFAGAFLFAKLLKRVTRG